MDFLIPPQDGNFGTITKYQKGSSGLRMDWVDISIETPRVDYGKLFTRAYPRFLSWRARVHLADFLENAFYLDERPKAVHHPAGKSKVQCNVSIVHPIVKQVGSQDANVPLYTGRAAQQKEKLREADFHHVQPTVDARPELVLAAC